jgi:hypothetical protein
MWKSEISKKQNITSLLKKYFNPQLTHLIFKPISCEFSVEGFLKPASQQPEDYYLQLPVEK